MDVHFRGKKALVTGAGQGMDLCSIVTNLGYEYCYGYYFRVGIGRAIAKRLYDHGATVFALSKSQEGLNTLQQELEGIQTVCVDLSDWEATRRLVDSVGHVDMLVNNAGLAICESFLEMTPESFDKLFAVNVKACINVAQVVAQKMIERRSGGSIVNISSQASQKPLKDHLAYCATKASLDMVSRVMALELGSHKIRVNCVNPTVVLTEMGRKAWSEPGKAAPMLAAIPLGRFADVEEVVDAVVYLLSDRAAMINGVTLPVDGGFLAG